MTKVFPIFQTSQYVQIQCGWDLKVVYFLHLRLLVHLCLVMSPIIMAGNILDSTIKGNDGCPVIPITILGYRYEFAKSVFKIGCPFGYTVEIQIKRNSMSKLLHDKVGTGSTLLLPVLYWFCVVIKSIMFKIL